MRGGKEAKAQPLTSANLDEEGRERKSEREKRMAGNESGGGGCLGLG